MSAAIQISDALLRNVASRSSTPADGAKLLDLLGGARRWKKRKWQSSPDRTASVHRKRKLGGSSGMPADMRAAYTEGERACLAVIAGEVKHHGICDLPIDRIAAVAGVSRTTVQNAVRKARARMHLRVQQRPRKGMKNLTNVIHVMASSWLKWIKRAPALAREIGFNLLHPTKNQDISSSYKGGDEGKNRGAERAEWVAMGFGRGSKPSWRVLAQLLGQGDDGAGWRRLRIVPTKILRQIENGFASGTLRPEDIPPMVGEVA